MGASIEPCGTPAVLVKLWERVLLTRTWKFLLRKFDGWYCKRMDICLLLQIFQIDAWDDVFLNHFRSFIWNWNLEISKNRFLGILAENPLSAMKVLCKMCVSTVSRFATFWSDFRRCGDRDLGDVVQLVLYMYFMNVC